MFYFTLNKKEQSLLLLNFDKRELQNRTEFLTHNIKRRWDYIVTTYFNTFIIHKHQQVTTLYRNRQLSFVFIIVGYIIRIETSNLV